MELTRQIKGNIHYFFDRVEQSLIEDIEQSTGNKISINEIVKGFTYSKNLTSQLGRTGRVKVIINEYQRLNKYSVSFISAQGENILSYETKEIDDTKFEIKYTEDFNGSWYGNLNYKLMSLLYKRSSLKKANMLLNNIENMMQNDKQK